MNTKEKLISNFRKNPTNVDSFTNLVEYLRNSGDYNGARDIRMEFRKHFSLNEQMWLEWLEDEISHSADLQIYNNIINLALEDLPLSIKIHQFRIDHAQTNEDKISFIIDSSSKIGAFDNHIWDLYRSECPEKSNEIWAKQLSQPVPNYYSILKQAPDPLCHQEPSQSLKDLINTLSLCRSDPKSLINSYRLIRMVPQPLMFEYALSQHPYAEAIWAKYIESFPSSTNAIRSVRFCPSSGLLWSLCAKIIPDVDVILSGLNFMTNIEDAQILLGELLHLYPNQSRKIVEKALETSIFSSGDAWVFPTLILDDILRREGALEEQRKLLDSALERNSQRKDLWLRRIQIEIDAKDDIQAREIFKKASKAVRVGLETIIQNWISFEASIPVQNQSSSNDGYSILLNRISELRESENDLKGEDSIKDNYEKRTVFVAGYPASTTENELYEYFKAKEADIQLDGTIESFRFKGKFCFIQFKSQNDAENFIVGLNGVEFINKAGDKGNLDIKPHQTKKIVSFYIRYNKMASHQDVIDFLAKNGFKNVQIRLMDESKTSGSKFRTKGTGFVDIPEDKAISFMTLNGKNFLAERFTVEVANETKGEAHSRKVKEHHNQPTIPQKKETQQQNTKPTVQRDDQYLREFFGF